MTGEDRFADIVRQAQAQDSGQLLALLQEFENVIAGAAKRFYVPPAERGDLLQEAYIAFLLAVQQFDPARGVPFAAYAKRKTHERVWQYIRVRGRHRSRELADNPLSDSEDAAGTLLSSLPDPAAESPFCELGWRSLLASLSEREALAVEKIVIDGLSMAELARLEGVSAGTVKTWKQRALVKIREEIKKTRG
ncbi:RNA polymerase sigma factor (sigma-70 family) [Tumebacillus sp. BK434]|uniref:RNA polymerase sigma factor n=1 Tax=Tumebacillus sp. BK434 TaxID=2512169 RepID=UPI001049E2FC|nr:sigma-70 family RNA polymerase sigma factor [Tumebacillus sp. BK434]TCP57765.1 RNA polymerase sigma factor (sigma-70 family) [Tumebacillus sp. BK434]